MNKIHIVAGHSAGGCLKYSLKDDINKAIIILKDYLSIGPLTDLENNNGIEQRIHYFNEIHKKIFQDNYEKSWKEEIGINELLELKNNKSELFYYFTKSTNEQIYLRAICYYLNNCEINLININEILKDNSIISTAQINPKLLKNLSKKSSKISKETRDKLANEFKKIITNDSTFRIFKCGEIISTSPSLIDKIILEKTDSYYISAAKITAKVLSNINFELSDLFVDYRIRVLIEKKQIISKEKNKVLRDLLIKKA